MSKTIAEKIPHKFTKAQLLEAARFIRQSDLLGVLLKDNERYSIAEVEALIDKHMKGKVG